MKIRSDSHLELAGRFCFLTLLPALDDDEIETIRVAVEEILTTLFFQPTRSQSPDYLSEMFITKGQPFLNYSL